MPKFVIERAIPGIGASKATELQAISEKSCSVLQELGPQVQWVHSYVTGDKIYCVYNAANEELVRDHARRGGFPGEQRRAGHDRSSIRRRLKPDAVGAALRAL